MSTNSNVAILNDDGTVEMIYCHWDGYPEHNGEILRDSYNDEEKVRFLIAHGDLSVLGDDIFDTEFYGRDRGEEDVDAQTFDNIHDALELSAEWFYLFIPGEGWQCAEDQCELSPLSTTLKQRELDKD